MSLFDEDELEYEYYGHTGLVFNGDFDVEYLGIYKNKISFFYSKKIKD